VALVKQDALSLCVFTTAKNLTVESTPSGNELIWLALYVRPFWLTLGDNVFIFPNAYSVVDSRKI
jgi:hypothetical protein